MFSLDRVPTLAPIQNPTRYLFRRPIPGSLPIRCPRPRRSIEISERLLLRAENCYNQMNKLISRTLSPPLGLIRSQDPVRPRAP